MHGPESDSSATSSEVTHDVVYLLPHEKAT